MNMFDDMMQSTYGVIKNRRQSWLENLRQNTYDDDEKKVIHCNDNYYKTFYDHEAFCAYLLCIDVGIEGY